MMMRGEKKEVGKIDSQFSQLAQPHQKSANHCYQIICSKTLARRPS